MSEPVTNGASDEGLMAHFVKDLDEDSFQEIVARHYSSALVIAGGVLNDGELARDAVQETFIRVIRERKRYDLRRPFAPWFYTILRNLCLDIRRKESRYRETLLELAETVGSEREYSSTGSARDLLEALPSADRDILVLRLIEGMSFEEIAEYLACTIEAAKKRCQRALRRLRQRETSGR